MYNVVMSQRLNVRFPGGGSRARQAIETVTEHVVAEVVVAKIIDVGSQCLNSEPVIYPEVETCLAVLHVLSFLERQSLCWACRRMKTKTSGSSRRQDLELALA